MKRLKKLEKKMSKLMAALRIFRVLLVSTNNFRSREIFAREIDHIAEEGNWQIVEITQRLLIGEDRRKWRINLWQDLLMVLKLNGTRSRYTIATLTRRLNFIMIFMEPRKNYLFLIKNLIINHWLDFLKIITVLPLIECPGSYFSIIHKKGILSISGALLSDTIFH